MLAWLPAGWGGYWEGGGLTCGVKEKCGPPEKLVLLALWGGRRGFSEWVRGAAVVEGGGMVAMGILGGREYFCCDLQWLKVL